MRPLIFTFLLLLLAVASQADTGLNNETKAFTPPSEMQPSDWSDPAEIARTWRAALVRIPSPGGGYLSMDMDTAERATLPHPGPWPTVIYLHGCDGLWQGTHTRIGFLATHGYAAIAPVSFARQKYPQSCDTDHYRGGLYRPTLQMRHHDASHAIATAKSLPWVDADQVFLMGLSEGGLTTATFVATSPDRAVRARIVEGWTCHAADWPEYAGLNAPETEPVLTLVGIRDPWFQDDRTRGDYTPFISPTNGSRSVVYETGVLSTQHELLESKTVRDTVLTFLRRHTAGAQLRPAR